jgi:hypothetical protein
MPNFYRMAGLVKSGGGVIALERNCLGKKFSPMNGIKQRREVFPAPLSFW